VLGAAEPRVVLVAEADGREGQRAARVLFLGQTEQIGAVAICVLTSFLQ